MTNFSCPGGIRRIFAIALLLSVYLVHADIHDRIEYKLNRVLKDVDTIINNQTSSCVEITQLAIDEGGGVYVISASGRYCLAENVVGTIVIADQDSVCLDLGCYQISAGGEPNAIVVTDSIGTSITNGRVFDASEAGILVSGSSAISISDVHFDSNPVDSIRVILSNDITIKEADFVGDNGGECAIKCAGCNNVSITSLSIVDFTSTNASLLEFNGSTNIVVTDGDLSNNTKSLAAPNDAFSLSARFVSVDECDIVTLRQIRVVGNTINSSISGNKQFQAIGLTNSTDCTLSHCETSFNEDIVGGTATDEGLFIGLCEDVMLAGFQANNNIALAAVDNLYGVHTFNSDGILIGDSRITNNQAAGLNVYTSTPSAVIGIFHESPDGSITITKTIANGTTCTNGGTRTLSDAQGFVAGIVAYGKAYLDHTQASEGFMGTTGTQTNVYGAMFASTLDVIVATSYFEDNNGGDYSAGICFVPTADDTEEAVRSVINSSASFNNGYGVIVVPNPSGPSAFSNLLIDNTILNQNNHATLEAAGAFFNVTGADNIYISGSEINGNFSSGAPAFGIFVANASNVVISGSHVLETAGTLGYGIFFDTITDGEVYSSRCCGNQTTGIELDGSNSGIVLLECLAQDNSTGFSFAQTSTASCCLVQDCRAISNANFGFEHATSPLTTTFVGNEAQCNGSVEGDNYVINGGVINLQQLSWTTGDFTVVTGTDERSRWSNIVAVP